MQREMLLSKIHRVSITQADVNYIGSITIDESLMIASDIVEGQKVQVVNTNNGERLETYVIKGKKNAGQICLNGPAARKAVIGDIVIIIAYGLMDSEEARTFKPKLIFPHTTTNLLK